MFKPNSLAFLRLQAISNASPWLFTAGRSCRIVVHMRRGDLSVASANRELPTTYYMNVVKNLIKVNGDSIECKLVQHASIACSAGSHTAAVLIHFAGDVFLVLQQRFSCSCGWPSWGMLPVAHELASKSR